LTECPPVRPVDHWFRDNCVPQIRVAILVSSYCTLFHAIIDLSELVTQLRLIVSRFVKPSNLVTSTISDYHT